MSKVEGKSKGLGDTLAKMFHAVGMDYLADKTAKALGMEDCGCDERQEKLNELFPYKNKDSEEKPTE